MSFHKKLCTKFLIVLFLTAPFAGHTFSSSSFRSSQHSIPNFLGQPSGGGTEDIMNVSLGAGGESFLGCNGFNFQDMMFANFDISDIGTKLENYFTTAISTWLLTHIYSSPALSALFDSMEAFGNARVSLLQSRCDINEIKTKAKSIAQQRCIEKHGEGTDAYRDCLGGGDIGKIRDSLNEVMNSLEFNGSLHQVLNMESVCGSNYNPSSDQYECPALLFVPDIRWGTGTESGNKRSKPALSGGVVVDTIAAESLGVFEAQTSAPLGNFKYSRNVAKLNQLYDECVRSNNCRRLGSLTASVDDGLSGVDKKAVAAKAPLLEHIKPEAALFAGPDDEDAGTDGTSYVKYNCEGENSGTPQCEFKQFTNCSYENPMAAWNEYLAYIASRDDVKELSASDREALREHTSKGLDELLGDLDIGTLDPDGSEVYKKLMTSNAASVGDLMRVAYGCVYNHHINVSVPMLIEMRAFPVEERDAILRAASNRIAALSTELILRFMKHKMLVAYADLAYGNRAPDSMPEGASSITEGGEAGESEMPQHVLEAVKLTADMFENQIAALRASQDAQKSFGDVIGGIQSSMERSRLRESARDAVIPEPF